jgi:hypothetical protein
MVKMATTRNKISQDDEPTSLKLIAGGKPDDRPPGKVEHRGGDRTAGKLTGRQHGFVNSVLKDHMNQSDAYRQNYSTENMSPQAIWVAASKLFALPKVGLMIEEGRAVQAKIAMHSGAALRGDLISKLKVLTDSKESDAVKIRAIEVLGKTELVSLFLDRREVNAIETLTVEEVTAELEESLRKAFSASA